MPSEDNDKQCLVDKERRTNEDIVSFKCNITALAHSWDTFQTYIHSCNRPPWICGGRSEQEQNVPEVYSVAQPHFVRLLWSARIYYIHS